MTAPDNVNLSNPANWSRKGSKIDETFLYGSPQIGSTFYVGAVMDMSADGNTIVMLKKWGSNGLINGLISRLEYDSNSSEWILEQNDWK